MKYSEEEDERCEPSQARDVVSGRVAEEKILRGTRQRVVRARPTNDGGKYDRAFNVQRSEGAGGGSEMLRWIA